MYAQNTSQLKFNVCYRFKQTVHVCIAVTYLKIRYNIWPVHSENQINPSFPFELFMS